MKSLLPPPFLPPFLLFTLRTPYQHQKPMHQHAIYTICSCNLSGSGVKVARDEKSLEQSIRPLGFTRHRGTVLPRSQKVRHAVHGVKERAVPKQTRKTAPTTQNTYTHTHTHNIYIHHTTHTISLLAQCQIFTTHGKHRLAVCWQQKLP